MDKYTRTKRPSYLYLINDFAPAWDNDYKPILAARSVITDNHTNRHREQFTTDWKEAPYE